MTPLRRRMTEDMQVRNFSPHTQNSYVQQVSLFARHFSKSPEVLGPEEIRSYQVYLTNEKKLVVSSILTAVSALRFLYKVTLHRDWCFEDIIPAPKKPQTLPIVLSPEEVLQFLSCVQSIKHRTILTTCYAAGLRVSEATRLKVADIDSERMVIRVEQGKCQKDRYVMLSPKLLQILRRWWPVNKPKQWLFPDKFEAQNVFFDVTQSQSGRDSAELARDGSRYLSEELIEFGHRGEGVKASAKCFVGSRKLRRALLRKQFPFACHGRSHFFRALQIGDVHDRANKLKLAGRVNQGLTHTP